MSTTMDSPLRLERCVLRELQIRKSQREHDNENGPPVKLKFGVKKHKSLPNRFLILLELEAESHHSVHISLEAEFVLPEDMTSEQVGVYVPTLCITNLVGIARGIITHATVYCENGPYTLPMLNVKAMLQNAVPEIPAPGTRPKKPKGVAQETSKQPKKAPKKSRG